MFWWEHVIGRKIATSRIYIHLSVSMFSVHSRVCYWQCFGEHRDIVVTHQILVCTFWWSNMKKDINGYLKGLASSRSDQNRVPSTMQYALDIRPAPNRMTHLDCVNTVISAREKEYLLILHGRCFQVGFENAKKRENTLWKNKILDIIIYWVFCMPHMGAKQRWPEINLLRGV